MHPTVWLAPAAEETSRVYPVLGLAVTMPPERPLKPCALLPERISSGHRDKHSQAEKHPGEVGSSLSCMLLCLDATETGLR